SHELGHLLAQAVIPILHRPAPMGESAAWVFLRTAGRLHHAIEREKRGHLELAHSLSSPEHGSRQKCTDRTDRDDADANGSASSCRLDLHHRANARGLLI